uniref:Calponin-homology (CH) domain-containing protein n=1 Tax=Octactis speculum TaxID=3111310 RepID=A0A7S2G3N3_9STRA|mmetsp:Transcript_37436/g.50656  ORF Transcript_37436/g.50656 Transcript_37436/m.50656 type:complete len:571 (+) Transcript_37436:65-1777(+)
MPRAGEGVALDQDALAETQRWIEHLTGGSLDEEGGFQAALKDGKRLCALINAIQPGTIKKISDSKIAFKQMENISKFHNAAVAFGVPKEDIFTIPDLYEDKDIGGVVRTVQAVGRHTQNLEGFAGPYLGARLATETKRTFTEETLRKGAGEMSAWSGGKTMIQERTNFTGTERMGKDITDKAISDRDAAAAASPDAPKPAAAAEESSAPILLSIPLRIGEGPELVLVLHEDETPEDAAEAFCNLHGLPDPSPFVTALGNALHPPVEEEEEVVEREEGDCLISPFAKNAVAKKNKMTPEEIQAEMAELKPKVVAELNLLRTDPVAYGDKLALLLPRFDGMMYTRPGREEDEATTTAEGAKALQRAIDYLQGGKVQPATAFTQVEGLDLTAQDGANQIRYSAGMGSVGKQQHSTSLTRAEAYGQWKVLFSEVNCTHTRVPEGIVAELCLCDGDKTHRMLRDLLHPDLKVCGVGCGPHPTMEYACCVSLAGGWGPKPVDKRRIVFCKGGSEPDDRFMEVLNSVPEPDFIDELIDQISQGSDVHLNYTPSGVDAKITDSEGEVTEYNLEWEEDE